MRQRIENNLWSGLRPPISALIFHLQARRLTGMRGTLRSFPLRHEGQGSSSVLRLQLQTIAFVTAKLVA